MCDLRPNLAMRLYVSCGLTHVPRHEFDEYARLIHAIARSCEENGAEVRYALRDSDPQLAVKPTSERARLCYLWDREMVEWADAVVADATYPSIGVGIELQIAEQRGMPIVLCYRRSAVNQAAVVEYENPDRSQHSLQIGEGYVSLMALGVPTIFRVVGYTSSEDALRSVVDAVATLTNRSL